MLFRITDLIYRQYKGLLENTPFLSMTELQDLPNLKSGYRIS